MVYVAGIVLLALGIACGALLLLIPLGVTGAILMLLALGAAIALVLQAASLFEPAGSTLSLWYVLVLGLLLGATGLATRKTAT
jgi:hypothetical protein